MGAVAVQDMDDPLNQCDREVIFYSVMFWEPVYHQAATTGVKNTMEANGATQMKKKRVKMFIVYRIISTVDS